VQFFRVDCDFSTKDFHQKERKEYGIKTVEVIFFLEFFSTFFNNIKSVSIDIFSITSVIF